MESSTKQPPTPNTSPLFSVADILEWTGGTLQQGSRDQVISGLSNDSRALQRGHMFVALVAERDGHTFIPNALEAGASALLVSQRVQDIPSDITVVQVKDTLGAMGAIAAGYRRRFSSCQILGITGSNGKTTTKEMIASILRNMGPTLATAGNLNNLIGLPLTLLGLRSEHAYAVLEMGMNVPGEIAQLAAIAAPDVGVITCVAPAHLEGLGSIEGVARAKGELFDALQPQQWAVVNADDPHVLALGLRVSSRVIFFTMNPTQANIPAGQPVVSLQHLKAEGEHGFHFQVDISHLPTNPQKTQRLSVELPLVGRHQVANALAAIAATVVLGVSEQAITTGLRNIKPTGRRLLLEHTPIGVHLLDDCYNSNPHSCRAALQTLRELAGHAPSIAVIGDMLELGTHEAEAHEQIGHTAASLDITLLVAFGPRSRNTAQAARHAGMKTVSHFEDIDELWAYLQPLLTANTWVLVKGSRGMRLERISEKIKQLHP